MTSISIAFVVAFFSIGLIECEMKMLNEIDKIDILHLENSIHVMKIFPFFHYNSYRIIATDDIKTGSSKIIKKNDENHSKNSV